MSGKNIEGSKKIGDCASISSSQTLRGPHTFHIPVMGTGFTVDTPLRLAKYGITSVVSIGDDILIEKMRKFYGRVYGRPYVKIDIREEDARARRITEYLNMIDQLVAEQLAALKESPFEPGSDIVRYYDLLPDSSLKTEYLTMLAATNPKTKLKLQESLRTQAIAGRIDVNIMTKLDRDMYRRGEKLPARYSLAMSALRGYAKSTLNSAIVLSAGINRRLFSYMAEFDDFFPVNGNLPRKEIAIKVSDYRSALLQGRMLARQGLWVSEFRMESGLNCGGHAFATKGALMGPILEEFLQRREDLADQLYTDYQKALSKLGRDCPPRLPVRVTAQGGIYTNAEHEFLLAYYRLDKTGWGTPFLLVPEATNVDVRHLRKLIAAGKDDVSLSDSSPLGIPFWNLKTSDSEEMRKERIRRGKPGSPCTKGYLGIETEFSKLPLCRASRSYQQQRIKQLTDDQEMSKEKKDAAIARVLSRACICLDLAGGAEQKHALASSAKTAVCCGPGISNFGKIASLEEMLDHIYGRGSLIPEVERSHMFIEELRLYIEYLRCEIKKTSQGLIDRTAKYFAEFKEQLLDGIEYYHNLAKKLDSKEKEKFLQDLKALKSELRSILLDPLTPAPLLAIGEAGQLLALRDFKLK